MTKEKKKGKKRHLDCGEMEYENKAWGINLIFFKAKYVMLKREEIIIKRLKSCNLILLLKLCCISYSLTFGVNIKLLGDAWHLK